MQIDKQQILDLLRQQGNNDQANQAEGELPDQVDTDRDQGLLEKFGINSGLLANLPGIGDLGKKFGL
jgi:hypothetical protein